MTENKLEYLGPLPADMMGTKREKPSWKQRVPWAFILIVGLPTLASVLYFLVIAAPRYVSEARFIVRAPAQSQPSSFDVALQGVGLSSTQTDAFAVHEYIASRDGLRELEARIDVRRIFGKAPQDFLARYPRPWEGRTQEGLFKAYGRFVTVGYDSTTGISTLRIEAFTPDDARNMAAALLDGGENLINRLNDRAYGDAVEEAAVTIGEAEARLSTAQNEIANFRNSEGFIDPSRSALEGAQLIGDLAGQLAILRAERSQIAEETPDSPQLPIVDGRIRAFERQVESEREKIAGNADSLAPKIGVYEDLVLNREVADRSLTQARASYDSSVLQARRQKLYLQRVVEASRPDSSTQPRRWIGILTVFASSLLIYGVIWLVSASLREHRQG